MEIGIRMNSRRLEKYRAAMEGLLSEVLLSTQDGTAGGHTAQGQPPPTPN